MCEADHEHAQPARCPRHVARHAGSHHRVECWITAGGAHHTVLSYDVTAEQMKDWATMMDIEFVHITKDTTVESLEQQLFLNDLAWKLK